MFSQPHPKPMVPFKMKNWTTLVWTHNNNQIVKCSMKFPETELTITRDKHFSKCETKWKLNHSIVFPLQLYAFK
jgi:hypothetical protein